MRPGPSPSAQMDLADMNNKQLLRYYHHYCRYVSCITLVCGDVSQFSDAVFIKSQDFVLISSSVSIHNITMDAVMSSLHAQLAQLRTKLDDIPALQKLEVSCTVVDAPPPPPPSFDFSHSYHPPY